MKHSVGFSTFREIYHLEDLKLNPHIVNIFDLYSKEKNLYIVMEFMSHDLLSMIKHHSLSE